MKKFIVLFVMTLGAAQLFAQLTNISSPTSPLMVNTAEQHAARTINSLYSWQYNSPVNSLTAFKKSPAEKKKHYILRGMLIGGAIGIAPVVFGQGGGYVAIFTFPTGLITGAILGASARRRHRND